MLNFKITIIGLLSALAALISGSKHDHGESNSRFLLCYYEGEIPLNNIDVSNCTHLIFTNAVTKNASNNSLHVSEEIKRDLASIKEAKSDLLTIFSLDLKKNESSMIVESENKSRNLLNGITNLLQESEFDGVELNFQFASKNSGSKDSYASFVKMLSKSLDSQHRRTKRDGYDVFEKQTDDFTTAAYTTQAPKTGTSKTQSIKSRTNKPRKSRRKIREDSAAYEERKENDSNSSEGETTKQTVAEESTPTQTTLKEVEENNKFWLIVRLPIQLDIVGKKYDLKALSRYADLLSVPTHNIVDESESNLTYHPSRLIGLSDIFNTDSIVDFLLGMGALKSKIVISLPASVYKFQLKDPEKNTPKSPFVLGPQRIDQSELCSMFRKKNWTLERDEDLTAPYAYSGHEWLAFEDEISVNIKGKYILLRELAGGAIYPIDDDVNDESCTNKTGKGGYLTSILKRNFENLSRKPRALVLDSLQREIHEAAYSNIEAGIHLSEYRIVRVVDHSGAVHVIRKNSKTEFQCSRQGYFSHPLGCNKFYRCVKFDQYSDEFTVFEYDCPVGLAFDERWEVCVWPGSLPNGAPCTGSSEIAPVPRSHYQCPNREGYYADPENCRWFFACLDHAHDGVTPLTAYEFRCPFGLVFNEQKLACDWPWVEGACGNRGGSGYLGLSSGVHTTTFLNGGNLEATLGQYGKNFAEASVNSIGRGYGTVLKNIGGYYAGNTQNNLYQNVQNGQNGATNYVANQFIDGFNNTSAYGSFPVYGIPSGGSYNQGSILHGGGNYAAASIGSVGSTNDALHNSIKESAGLAGTGYKSNIQFGDVVRGDVPRGRLGKLQKLIPNPIVNGQLLDTEKLVLAHPSPAAKPFSNQIEFLSVNKGQTSDHSLDGSINYQPLPTGFSQTDTVHSQGSAFLNAGQHSEGQFSAGQHSGEQFSTGQNSGGQFSTGQHSGGQFSTGQNSGGQFSTGQHSGGQFSTGQHSGGQFSTGQNSGGQFSTEQHSGGQFSTGQNSGGQFSGGQYSTGQYSGGQYSTGQHSGGQFSTGQNSGGQFSTGQISGGQYSTGQHSGGQYSTGQYSGGQYSTGQNSGGQFSTEQHSGGQYSSEKHSGGQETLGQQAGGEHFVKQHNEEQHFGAQHSGSQLPQTNSDHKVHLNYLNGEQFSGVPISQSGDIYHQQSNNLDGKQNSELQTDNVGSQPLKYFNGHHSTGAQTIQTDSNYNQKSHYFSGQQNSGAQIILTDDTHNKEKNYFGANQNSESQAIHTENINSQVSDYLNEQKYSGVQTTQTSSNINQQSGYYSTEQNPGAQLIVGGNAEHQQSNIFDLNPNSELHFVKADNTKGQISNQLFGQKYSGLLTTQTSSDHNQQLNYNSGLQNSGAQIILTENAEHQQATNIGGNQNSGSQVLKTNNAHDQLSNYLNGKVSAGQHTYLTNSENNKQSKYYVGQQNSGAQIVLAGNAGHQQSGNFGGNEKSESHFVKTDSISDQLLSYFNGQHSKGTQTTQTSGIQGHQSDYYNGKQNSESHILIGNAHQSNNFDANQNSASQVHGAGNSFKQELSYQNGEQHLTSHAFTVTPSTTAAGGSGAKVAFQSLQHLGSGQGSSSLHGTIPHTSPASLFDVPVGTPASVIKELEHSSLGENGVLGGITGGQISTTTALPVVTKGQSVSHLSTVHSTNSGSISTVPQEVTSSIVSVTPSTLIFEKTFTAFPVTQSSLPGEGFSQQSHLSQSSHDVKQFGNSFGGLQANVFDHVRSQQIGSTRNPSLEQLTVPTVFSVADKNLQSSGFKLKPNKNGNSGFEYNVPTSTTKTVFNKFVHGSTGGVEGDLSHPAVSIAAQKLNTFDYKIANEGNEKFQQSGSFVSVPVGVPQTNLHGFGQQGISSGAKFSGSGISHHESSASAFAVPEAGLRLQGLSDYGQSENEKGEIYQGNAFGAFNQGSVGTFEQNSNDRINFKYGISSTGSQTPYRNPLVPSKVKFQLHGQTQLEDSEKSKIEGGVNYIGSNIKPTKTGYGSQFAYSIPNSYSSGQLNSPNSFGLENSKTVIHAPESTELNKPHAFNSNVEKLQHVTEVTIEQQPIISVGTYQSPAYTGKSFAPETVTPTYVPKSVESSGKNQIHLSSSPAPPQQHIATSLPLAPFTTAAPGTYESAQTTLHPLPSIPFAAIPQTPNYNQQVDGELTKSKLLASISVQETGTSVLSPEIPNHKNVESTTFKPTIQGVKKFNPSPRLIISHDAFGIQQKVVPSHAFIPVFPPQQNLFGENAHKAEVEQIVPVTPKPALNQLSFETTAKFPVGSKPLQSSGFINSHNTEQKYEQISHSVDANAYDLRGEVDGPQSADVRFRGETSSDEGLLQHSKFSEFNSAQYHTPTTFKASLHSGTAQSVVNSQPLLKTVHGSHVAALLNEESGKHTEQTHQNTFIESHGQQEQQQLYNEQINFDGAKATLQEPGSLPLSRGPKVYLSPIVVQSNGFKPIVPVLQPVLASPQVKLRFPVTSEHLNEFVSTSTIATPGQHFGQFESQKTSKVENSRGQIKFHHKNPYFNSQTLQVNVPEVPGKLFNYDGSKNVTTGSSYSSYGAGVTGSLDTNVKTFSASNEYNFGQGIHTTNSAEFAGAHKTLDTGFKSVQTEFDSVKVSDFGRTEKNHQTDYKKFSYETVNSNGLLEKVEGQDETYQLLNKYPSRFGKISSVEEYKEKFESGLANERDKFNGSPRVPTFGQYEGDIVKTRPKSRGRQYLGSLGSGTATNTPEHYLAANGGSFEDSVEKNKKTVVFVSQVSDANPILIGKLAGQCSCQSNLLELRGKGRKHESGRQKNKNPANLNRGGHSLYENDQSNDDEAEVTSQIGTGSGAEQEANRGGKSFSASTTARYETDNSPRVVSTPLSIVVPVTTPDGRLASRGKQFRGKARYLPPTPSSFADDYSETRSLFSPVSALQVVGTSNAGDFGAESKAQNAINGRLSSTYAGAAFDRYGPGGWRSYDETLQGSVDCKRPGLFRHPKYCNKFYACNYDPWEDKFTLHVFNCPIRLTYDNSISACNWPVGGPACADDNLLV